MKQTRFLSTLIVFLLSVAGLSAQEAVISGSITDATTGDPLPGAKVSITNTNYGGATDINGITVFQLLPLGKKQK